MSFSRVLTSSCRPLARGHLPVPRPAAPLTAPFLSSTFRFRQKFAAPVFRQQRTAGVTTRVPSRVMTTSNLVEQVQEKNKKFPVLVYSKTWCPYCSQVKGLFSHLKVEYTAIELDEVVEGDDVMDALEDMTHSRTVPQVFVNGEFIGGCDDTMDAYNSGQLNEKLSAAGIAVEN